MNPIQPFLERYGILVLDGGFATQLEAHGCDLNDSLWSARLLHDDPDLIRQVHSDYLWAGADCIISASYQATIPGFVAAGFDVDTAVKLLQDSAQLALTARDKYWGQVTDKNGRIRPLVAASIGPYAAYKADGSEYTGVYDLDAAGLVDFHAERWRILNDTAVDLFACETISNFDEARALAQLLIATPDRYAWFSFACRDGQHISDGTPLAKCATFLDDFAQVAAIGINCTAPRCIPELIKQVGAVSHKPIIVYPNSGETYDAVTHSWTGETIPAEFGTFSREWRKLGAGLIGGCCRTAPAHIRQIRDRFRWEIMERNVRD